MEPDDLLCSRNARLQKVLVRRAHSRIGQATPLREKTSERGGTICIRALLDSHSRTSNGALPGGGQRKLGRTIRNRWQDATDQQDRQ